MAGPWENYQSPEAGPWTKYQPKPNTAKDVARSGAQGAAKSATGLAGMAGDVRNVLMAGAEKLATPKQGEKPNFMQNALSTAVALGKVAGSARGPTMNALALPSSQQINDKVGLTYKPQTRAGEVAEKVGTFAGNALAGPAGGAKGVVGQVVGRAANVAAPVAVGYGAKGVAKAAGAGETGQAVAEFAGNVLGGGATAVRAPKIPARKPPAPTLESLTAQKNAAYKAVDDMGVQYEPGAISQMVDGISESMDAAMLDRDLHPKATAVLKRIEQLHETPVTLGKLDQIRRLVRDNVLASPSRDERRLGRLMMDSIDEFIDAAGPNQVRAGDPARAASTIRQARELNTRVAKIETVNTAQAKAKARTDTTGSGGNIDNATRQEMRKILERGRNWTPAERSALEGIQQGAGAQNVLRQVGKLSPTGNGLMAGLNLLGAGGAGAAAGPMGAAAAMVPGGIGFVAKHIADNMTRRRVEGLVDLIARGGKPALDAEEQLALMAQRNAQVRKVYQDLANRIFMSGALATASGSAQGQ